MARDTFEVRLTYHDETGAERAGRTARFLNMAEAVAGLESYRAAGVRNRDRVLWLFDEASRSDVAVETRAALYVNGLHVPVDGGDVRFGAFVRALAEVER